MTPGTCEVFHWQAQILGIDGHKVRLWPLADIAGKPAGCPSRKQADMNLPSKGASQCRRLIRRERLTDATTTRIARDRNVEFRLVGDVERRTAVNTRQI